MERTGIIRRVDEAGRVSLPVHIRRDMGLQEGSPVEYFLNDDKTLCLRRYFPIGEVVKEEAHRLIEAFHNVFGAEIVVINEICQPVASTEKSTMFRLLDAPGLRSAQESDQNPCSFLLTQMRAALNSNLPANLSAFPSVTVDGKDIRITGFSRIVTNNINFANHCEGAVIVVGEENCGQKIAETIAATIRKAVEEMFT